jgi:hypothetical protein
MYVICTLMFARLVAQARMLLFGVGHRHWWNQRRKVTPQTIGRDSISDLPATSRLARTNPKPRAQSPRAKGWEITRRLEIQINSVYSVNRGR